MRANIGRAKRSRPNRLGRIILRRLFDEVHDKPRPHAAFSPPKAPTDAPPKSPVVS
ncbi:MAG: hypothetical protein K1X71_16180 [Pirellulales bacterium]|nr:hypothetical protein [Pirellulales bacterium]